jgi:putative DNA primase/helicase
LDGCNPYDNIVKIAKEAKKLKSGDEAEEYIKNENDKLFEPYKIEELDKIIKDVKKHIEDRKKRDRKKAISLSIQGTLSNPLTIAKALQEHSPLYFDTSRNFWLWNAEICCYERVDETELLCAISEAFNCTIYNKTVKGEVLESLRITGRLRRVEPVKKSWIQFLNGVFDYETGDTFEATSDYFFTSPIPHRLGDREETPIIDKLFKDWLNEQAPLLLEICAYCLLDDYPIQRIFAFQGSGSNGKSQYIEMLQTLLGSTNCAATELEKLTQSRFEVSKLLHKKAAFIGDAGYATLTKTHMLKALTGGDLISAEFKGKDSFDFVNTAKICMATNNMPESADTTDGYYRRWCSVEFKNKFPDGKAITATIPEEEYENLCRKCLNILKNIIAIGYLPHEPPRDRRKSIYEALANPVKAFIEDECEIETDESTPMWYLHEKYEEYRERKGQRSLSKDEFSKKLKSLGFEADRIWFTTEMQQKYTEKQAVDRKQWRSIVGVRLKGSGDTDTVNDSQKNEPMNNDKFFYGDSCSPQIQSEPYIENRVNFGVTAVTTQIEKVNGRTLKNENVMLVGVTKPPSPVATKETLDDWEKSGVLITNNLDEACKFLEEEKEKTSTFSLLRKDLVNFAKTYYNLVVPDIHIFIREFNVKYPGYKKNPGSQAIQFNAERLRDHGWT